MCFTYNPLPLPLWSGIPHPNCHGIAGGRTDDPAFPISDAPLQTFPEKRREVEEEERLGLVIFVGVLVVLAMEVGLVTQTMGHGHNLALEHVAVVVAVGGVGERSDDVYPRWVATQDELKTGNAQWPLNDLDSNPLLKLIFQTRRQIKFYVVSTGI